MSKIETEILKIETILAKYDSISVVNNMAFWLTRITERRSNPFFNGLKSPYKQLHYVASLALKNKTTGLGQISDDDWTNISSSLQEIEILYNNSFSQKNKELDTEHLKKVGVSSATFLTYFFNGTFAFKEQLIERIERTFKKYDSLIVEETGLSVQEFIDFVELVNDECNIKLNLPLEIQNSGDWIKFTEKMESLNVHPEEWKMHFNESFNVAFETLTQPSSILYCDVDNLHVTCDIEKLRTFLNGLSVPELNPSKTIYYGEILPLESNPFVKVSESKYLIFYHNEILSAIYKKLVDICSGKIGSKFYKHRDNKTEEKVVEIFELLFNKKKSKIFVNYSIDQHCEQDILIVFDSTALIVEVKASTFREPMRDPQKAFEKIKSDFKKNIQEAYNQCLRVEDAFEMESFVSVYDDKNQMLEKISTLSVENTYSIIVTLDRFGVIQSDLSWLLQIDKDLPFPWSVNIDDLETFFLMLKKQKRPQKKLVEFLKHRELLHERLYAMDEIDVCCWYLRNPKDFREGCNQHEAFIFANPQESDLVDKAYFSKGGLGFQNERNLYLKNNGNTLFLGMPE
ncbi:MAG: hypothetical protein KA278_01620 [Flavobacterium sp.]|nr:hypothetical protein [Flavobacterium sp.]